MSSPDSQATAVGRDRTPPSILWAHQMRRENIHLVDQIDNLTAMVSTTVESALAGRNSVEQLHMTARDLLDDNHRLREKIAAVERACIENVKALNLRIESLERKNIQLKTVLDLVEQKWTIIIEEEIKAMQDTKKEVLTEAKQLLESQREASRSGCGTVQDTAKAGREQRCQGFQHSPISSPPHTGRSSGIHRHDKVSPSSHEDSTILVPDSMPSNHSISLSVRQPLGHTTSESEVASAGSEQLYSILQQNGRTLAEYFSFAEETRAQLPRRRQDGVVVEAFLDGLTDESMKALLEKSMEDGGWTWDVIKAFCRRMEVRHENHSEEEKRAKAEDSNRKIEEPKQMVKDGKTTKAKRRRKRRCISLVPTDDESDLI